MNRDIDETPIGIQPPAVLCALGPLPDTGEPLTGPTRMLCITENVIHYDYEVADLHDESTWRLIETVPVLDSETLKNAA